MCLLECKYLFLDDCLRVAMHGSVLLFYGQVLNEHHLGFSFLLFLSEKHLRPQQMVITCDLCPNSTTCLQVIDLSNHTGLAFKLLKVFVKCMTHWGTSLEIRNRAALR